MFRFFKWLGIAAGLACLAAGAIVLSQSRSYPFFRRGALSSLYREASRRVEGIPASAYDADPAIACWGDSLTEGFGASPGHDFPSLITFLYHRRSTNFGIGGETSRQIRVRFLARAKPKGPETVVIWAGRNNADEPARIKSDIGDMIHSLGPDARFLVLGVITTAAPGEQRGADEYNLIMKLNADLLAAYGARFVPIHEILVSHGNQRFPDDRDNMKMDATPWSLRADQLHLNDIGQAVVAAAVQEALVANGW